MRNLVTMNRFERTLGYKSHYVEPYAEYTTAIDKFGPEFARNALSSTPQLDGTDQELSLRSKITLLLLRNAGEQFNSLTTSFAHDVFVRAKLRAWGLSSIYDNTMGSGLEYFRLFTKFQRLATAIVPPQRHQDQNGRYARGIVDVDANREADEQVERKRRTDTESDEARKARLSLNMYEHLDSHLAVLRMLFGAGAFDEERTLLISYEHGPPNNVEFATHVYDTERNAAVGADDPGVQQRLEQIRTFYTTTHALRRARIPGILHVNVYLYNDSRESVLPEDYNQKVLDVFRAFISVLSRLAVVVPSANRVTNNRIVGGGERRHQQQRPSFVHASFSMRQDNPDSRHRNFEVAVRPDHWEAVKTALLRSEAAAVARSKSAFPFDTSVQELDSFAKSLHVYIATHV